jgi:hypothetical protein
VTYWHTYPQPVPRPPRKSPTADFARPLRLRETQSEMRYFFRRRIPEFQRILLVESGSRCVLETLLPRLFQMYGNNMRVDLVTCYAGVPQGFREQFASVYRVNEYATRARRKQLYQELAANRYDAVGIICSAEPIMTKWKWAVALLVKAKVFVINENCDFFFLDYGHAGVICHFVLFRAGLAGGGAALTIGRLVFFPVTLAYLLLWAAAAHIRRKVRA